VGSTVCWVRNMKEIRLHRYLSEMSALYSFYRHSEFAFNRGDLQNELCKTEFDRLCSAALPFLKDSLAPGSQVRDQFEDAVREKVEEEVRNGLATLRRQILETAHSIFEKFLCHVVRVYLHVFPEILKNIDKTISFREVVELKSDTAVFDCIVEKEISDFSRRSLQEKRDYLIKHLKLTHQDDLWTDEGEEMWKDIDRKRQAIVHREETPEVSHEYLLRAINYLQRIMMGISIYAQADQGVGLDWPVVSDFIERKPQPTLKAK